MPFLQPDQSGDNLKFRYEQNQTDVDAACAYGKFLLENNDPNKALLVLCSVKDKHPHVPSIWPQMAKAYERLSHMEGAEKCYYNAVRIAKAHLPEQALVFCREYLLFYVRKNRLKDLAAHKSSLSKFEHAQNDVLAFDVPILFDEGEFERVAKESQALLLKNYQSYSFLLPYWLLSLFYCEDNKGLESAVDLLASKSIAPVCAQILSELLVYIQTGQVDIQKLEQIDLDEQSDDLAVQNLMRAIRGYAVMLKTLPSLQKPLDEELPSIYMVGDSHIVPSALREVYVEGMRYRLVPQLAVGIKAFHLAEDIQCRSFSALKWRLKNLPKKSFVLMSFGEIDCRLNGGFYPYLEKNPHVDAQVYVEEVVHKCISKIAQILEGQDVSRVWICNVPAPKFQISCLKELPKLAQIIQMYNTALQRELKNYDFKLIDVFSATARETGNLARDGAHVDNFHIDAQILVNVLEKGVNK